MMKAFILFLSAVVLSGVSLAQSADDSPSGVGVKIWMGGAVSSEDAGPGTVSLSGAVLPNDYAPSGVFTLSASQDLGDFATGKVVVRIEPGKVYEWSVNYYNILNCNLNVRPPQGYKVIINYIDRQKFNFFSETYYGSVRVQVVREDYDSVGLRAGEPSSLENGKIRWRVGLGSLLDGASAGLLVFSNLGISDDWSTIINSSLLSYEPRADYINVQTVSDRVRQIIAPQAAADVVTLADGSSFEIRFYAPSQITGYVQGINGELATFSGSPYVVYRVEKGDTQTSLKITSETKDGNGATVRASYTTLTRSGIAPAYEWKMTDWATVGANLAAEGVKEDIRTWSQSASGKREEIINIRACGAATNDYYARNEYTSYSWGEELTKKSIGSGANALVSEYTYYTDPNNIGSYSLIRSVASSDGSWIGYTYQPANSDDSEIGVLKTKHRPYLNAPATVPANLDTDNSGEVTYYTYSDDPFGVKARLASSITCIPGSEIARCSIEYNDDFAANNMPLVRAVRKDWLWGRQLVTQTFFYREDCSDDLYRGKIHSISRPDGSKTCYAYIRETDVKYASVVRICKIDGGASGYYSSRINSYRVNMSPSASVDPVYLTVNKTVVAERLYDSRGRCAKTFERVWNGQMWSVVGETSFSYNDASLLLSRTQANGAKYEAFYNGEQLSSEIDEMGTAYSYEYNAAGRIREIVCAEAEGVPAMRRLLVHNSLGAITREEAIGGGNESLVTSYLFDDGGNEISRSVPNSGPITTRRDPTQKQVAVTLADNGTKVTTFNGDGSIASVVGTAVVPEYYMNIDMGSWESTMETRYGSQGSARYKRVRRNWLGEIVYEEKPGYSQSGKSVYKRNFTYADDTGLLEKITEPGSTSAGLTQWLFGYNSVGERIRSALDVDYNGLLETSSRDRISEMETYYANNGSVWWKVSCEYAYLVDNVSTPTLISKKEIQLTGLTAGQTVSRTTDVEGRVLVTTTSVDRSAKTETTVVSCVGLNSQTTISRNGRRVSYVDTDGRKTNFSYDALGRLVATRDLRCGTSVTSYMPGTTLVYQVTDPDGNIVSTFGYDPCGRLALTIDANGNATRLAYDKQGHVLRCWGSGAQPVSYEYNKYGELVKMTTYRNADYDWSGETWPEGATSGGVTTWDYDEPSGLLWKKTDAAGHSTVFDYDRAGRLVKKSRARLAGASSTPVQVSYQYTEAGELKGKTYNDGVTQPVSYTYGRGGALKTVTDATGQRVVVYDSEKPWRIAYVQLPVYYGERQLTPLYTEDGVVGLDGGYRLGSYANPIADSEQLIGYSVQGRVSSVGFAGRMFNYGYLQNAGLLKERSINDASLRIDYTYESSRDLLIGVSSSWGADTRSRYTYTYDESGKKKTVLQSGSAFSDYGDGQSTYQCFQYTSRGELLESVGCLGSDPGVLGSQLPGRHFTYSYDSAGNRTSSGHTGDVELAEQYEVNDLNQYESKENNLLNTSGTAASDANVMVRGNRFLAGRQGKFWSDEVKVANSDSPYYGDLTILSKAAGASNAIYATIVKAMLAPALQNFSYDEDGNMTGDGMWIYGYDAENQLVRMETTELARTAGVPYRILEFTYDADGRRVQKRVIDGATGVDVLRRRYLYRGWNVIAELDAAGGTAGTIRKRYVWGLDITGSLSATGGIGALLEIVDSENGVTLFPTYDGNGNVATLVNASTGAVEASYEYSPYGEALRCPQNYAAKNPFRYSTKFTDDETGLIYFGRRFYNPRLGRFVCRDPLEEAGGINLYAYIRNTAINGWDYLGMDASVGGFFACGWAEAFMEWSPFASGGSAARAQLRWNDSSIRGFSAYARAREALHDARVKEAFDTDTSNPEIAKYIAAGIPVSYGKIGRTEALAYQDPQTGIWKSWNSGLGAPNSVTLGGTVTQNNGSGNAVKPDAGSGWGNVIVVYDGKQQRSVDKSGNPIPTSPGGPQLMNIALKTARDYRSAIDAQSLGQAARILKSNGVGQGSADYVVILDHGAKVVFADGSFQNKQMLGNDVLLPSDFKRVSPYLSSGGAICLYGCSAGGDPGYLQDIANATGHRVYGVPVDVLAGVNEAMRSPNPSSSTWIYRDPTQ